MMLLILFIPRIILAEQPSPEDPVLRKNRQYDFAQRLFNQGRFIRSAAEFERFVFYYPDDPQVPEARYMAARAYFEGEQYVDAAASSKAVIAKNPSASDTARFYLLLARCLIKLNDFNQALMTLENLLAIYQEPAIRDEARYLGTWVFIQTAQWPQARNWLGAISGLNKDRYAVTAIEEKLSATATIPRKHPRLAGLLAVVPGLGHLYTGRYQDALIAVVLNGLSLWASYEAFDNDQPALGSLLGVVGFNFYVGNIYSAVNNTHNFNRRARETFIDDLKRHTNIRLTIGSAAGGGMLKASIDF